MALDIDLNMVDGDVYISVGDDWTLMRASDEIGEIFCDDDYLFIEDHVIDGYQAFAPLVGQTGVRSEGETLADAQENLESDIDEYHHGPEGVQYEIEGTLVFDGVE